MGQTLYRQWGKQKWEREWQPPSWGLSNLFDHSSHQNVKNTPFYTVTQCALALVHTHKQGRNKSSQMSWSILCGKHLVWSALFLIPTRFPCVFPPEATEGSVWCLGCLDRVNDSGKTTYIIWCSGIIPTLQDFLHWSCSGQDGSPCMSRDNVCHVLYEEHIETDCFICSNAVRWHKSRTVWILLS